MSPIGDEELHDKGLGVGVGSRDHDSSWIPTQKLTTNTAWLTLNE